MLKSPNQMYQQTQAQTASKPKLLIMLYDGAVRFLRAGIEGIQESDYQKANNYLCKTQAIIHELISALNFDYSISEELLAIYEYLLHLLIKSNIEKNIIPAQEALEHLMELREAWVEASKMQATMGDL
ncbi:flagellar export chaperone FliS [Paenibacillus zanthoxyli]|uniref:flagellar export chaperone FliS n=1 Tax=Paenibacillus zanthoxyli TaxID=369399 RepID=UPI0004707586|nr:flagellar export chaperone FliS [Paenibacillus zanthoxyli]